ncbi:MAG: DUF2480 family protein [Sediminibacterium sp.]|nr:DUF2480 family protein [Sediminibacterium sp.]MBX9780416.1 DUF2480 family protein [Chitinophagaceae bacterium]
MEAIVNKVAESGILSVDLETFLPKEKIMVFDLKDYLFMGLILKEKDFRAALQSIDWNAFADAHVTITCSADAVIPMWANMLVASNLQPVAASIHFGTEEQLRNKLLLNNIEKIDPAEFADKRVVVKGCGETPIPEEAYVSITNKLRAVAKSIMYGEPCSTVPIFKRK